MKKLNLFLPFVNHKNFIPLFLHKAIEFIPPIKISFFQKKNLKKKKNVAQSFD